MYVEVHFGALDDPQATQHVPIGTAGRRDRRIIPEGLLVLKC